MRLDFTAIRSTFHTNNTMIKSNVSMVRQWVEAAFQKRPPVKIGGRPMDPLEARPGLGVEGGGGGLGGGGRVQHPRQHRRLRRPRTVAQRRARGPITSLPPNNTDHPPPHRSITTPQNWSAPPQEGGEGLNGEVNFLNFCSLYFFRLKERYVSRRQNRAPPLEGVTLFGEGLIWREFTWTGAKLRAEPRTPTHSSENIGPRKWGTERPIRKM